MNLDGLPQFIVTGVHRGPGEPDTRVVGRFSHLLGIRNTRGWLYRPSGVSIIGHLLEVPSAPNTDATFVTPDADLAPELQSGATFPWVDGYWESYQVAMILAPTHTWEHRTFHAEPAHFFEQDGITGWQRVDGPLPDGALDRGVREGAWDHEHCELCRAHIGASGEPDGYVNPDDRWLCTSCYTRYALPQDISFAAEA